MIDVRDVASRLAFLLQFEIPAVFNLNASPTPAMTSAMIYGGSSEVCCLCNKTVYAAERIATDGRIYHANCFRCHTCNKKLALGTYAQISGTLFCKPHFDAQFHAAGRYEVVTPTKNGVGGRAPATDGRRKPLESWNPPASGEPVVRYLDYLLQRIEEQQQHMGELRDALEDLRNQLAQ